MVGLSRTALGGEDETIDLTAEPDHIEAERPLVPSGGCGRGQEAIDDKLLYRPILNILDPSRVEIFDQRLLGWHLHDIEPQCLAAALLHAEHRLCGVIQHEAFRRHESETQLGMDETT